MIRSLILGLALLIASLPAGAQEDGKIYYGSRVGMHLTTVSKEGIGSEHAVIRLKHTAADAKAFCVGYVLDNSKACIKRTLAEVKVAGRITGNCRKLVWTDMYGRSFRFLGRAQHTDEMMADFIIQNIKSGEILNGTSASEYDTELTMFRQLCPGIA